MTAADLLAFLIPIMVVAVAIDAVAAVLYVIWAIRS